MAEEKNEKKDVKKSKEELKHERLLHVQAEELAVEKFLHTVKYEDLASDNYKIMNAYVDMVVKGVADSAVILGKNGVGKTWGCCNIANKQDVPFKYLNNFVTPQALYIKLYEYRDDPLVYIDDVSGLFDNEKNLSLLKALLWDNLGTGKREVSYETTKPMTNMWGEEVPRKFFSVSRYVIIGNNLPTAPRLKPHLDAVMSRTNYTVVKLDNDDLFDIYNQIIEKDYPGLSIDERREVLDYLRQETSFSSNNLDLRTIFKMFGFKKYSNEIDSPELWKQLSLNILGKDESLVVVENLVKDVSFASEEARVSKFEELTGKSRATYFEIKKRLNIPIKKRI